MKRSDLRSLKKNPQQLQEVANSFDPNTMREIESVVERYQNKDQAQLMAELRRVAAAERNAGNLDNTKIDNIAGMLGPMLSPEQQSQMQAIMQQLKNS